MEDSSKDKNASNRAEQTDNDILMTSAMPSAPGKAWEEVSASFDRFCLVAGIETLGAMMEADAEVACGPRHSRSQDRRGHRWGRYISEMRPWETGGPLDSFVLSEAEPGVTYGAMRIGRGRF